MNEKRIYGTREKKDKRKKEIILKDSNTSAGQ